MNISSPIPIIVFLRALLWGSYLLLSCNLSVKAQHDLFNNNAVLSYDYRYSTDSTMDRSMLGLLETSLHSLAENDRRGRRIGGFVMLGIGAGTVVGGATTLALAQNDDARITGYALLGGGALLSGLSLIPFNIRSESEHLYTAFQQAPDQTKAEQTSKFHYWDRRFEELAEKTKRERIIGGITGIVAAGITSLFIIEGSNRDKIHTFIWPALGGVSSILIESEVERRYHTYKQAKHDLKNMGSPISQ